MKAEEKRKILIKMVEIAEMLIDDADPGDDLSHDEINVEIPGSDKKMLMHFDYEIVEED